MHIQWTELLQVFGATVGLTALLVTLFGLGVRGMAKEAPEGGRDSVGASDAIPVLCFVLSFAIVVYAIYLIVVN